MIFHRNEWPNLTQAQADVIGAAWGDPKQGIEDGLTEPWTADLIAALVRATHTRRFLETGTSTGFTTAVVAKALQWVADMTGEQCSLVSVDRDQSRIARAQKRFETLTFSGVDVVLTIAEALLFLRALEENAFDMVFLDDYHAPPSYVREEVEAAFSVVREGGLILLHDTEGVYQLRDTVHEFAGISFFTMPAHKVGAGLGIIEVMRK